MGRIPRNRNAAAVIAIVVAWLGVLVLVLGAIGTVYLLTQNRGRDVVFSGGAYGKVYIAVTVGPSVLVATALLWGIAFGQLMNSAATQLLPNRSSARRPSIASNTFTMDAPLRRGACP
jgi:hypothetical protein